MPIGAWHDGDEWHEGSPDDLQDADLIRVEYQEDGETHWATIAGPFEDMDEAELEEWIEEWLDAEGYG